MSARFSSAAMLVSIVIILGGCSKATDTTSGILKLKCGPKTVHLSHGNRPDDAVVCAGDTVTWTHANDEFTVDFTDESPFSANSYSSTSKHVTSSTASDPGKPRCYKYTPTETTSDQTSTRLPEGHVIVLGGGGPIK